MTFLQRDNQLYSTDKTNPVTEHANFITFRQQYNSHSFACHCTIFDKGAVRLLIRIAAVFGLKSSFQCRFLSRRMQVVLFFAGLGLVVAPPRPQASILPPDDEPLPVEEILQLEELTSTNLRNYIGDRDADSAESSLQAFRFLAK